MSNTHELDFCQPLYVARSDPCFAGLRPVEEDDETDSENGDSDLDDLPHICDDSASDSDSSEDE